jgi:hypothetical protein
MMSRPASETVRRTRRAVPSRPTVPLITFGATERSRMPSSSRSANFWMASGSAARSFAYFASRNSM